MSKVVVKSIKQIDFSNLNRAIFKIATPTMFGFLGLILFEIVDIFWIGKIGSKAVASIGAAAFLEWSIFSIMYMTVAGVTSLVGRFIGAGRMEDAHNVIRDGFWPSMLVSAILILLLTNYSELLFTLMGLDQETTALAVDYFLYFILGIPIVYTLNLTNSIFNANGETFISAVFMLISLVFNIILDPFLIFGVWIFPEFGISGASISSVISIMLSLLMRVWYLRRYNLIPPISSFIIDASISNLLPILKIGVPNAITNLIWTMTFPFLASIITKFGMLPLAGMNVGTRIGSLAYYASVGLSVAISSMVAQAYGKKEYKLVGVICYKGILLSALTLIPVTVLFIYIPEQLIGILSDDPIIIENGASFLRITGVFEIFLGLELVFEGVFNGIGQTLPNLLIRVPLTIARVPLSYFFAISLDYGVNGIWWSLSITTFLKGFLMMMAFKIYYQRQLTS